MQSADLDSSDRPGLLVPCEGLFDQPAAAQAGLIAGMAGGSAVHIRASAVIVLGDVRSDVESPRGSHEILAVVSLVGTHGDAPRRALLLLSKHQQRRLALGEA